ncbi:hypothetical protein BDQ12DRAFT_692455 [Crucibulum laeve]|uniref:DUF6534 domain-containing protein n=1 Tax=Crucibulum laeve TaxID=68775 RepID=A0A5C3LUN3_9AGAR|nr:hypothetical protein BDQ12DRAFT_692455 [Crucibulum laeve]
MSTLPGMVHVDLGDSIGALEIGCLISVFFFGIETLQTHQYYRRFPEDRWMFKLLVTSVWLLELGHTIGVTFEVYRATITLFGQPQKLITFPALGAVTAISGIITFLVELFFSLRVFKVLPIPYRYIGMGCALVAFVRVIGSVFLAYQAITGTNIAIYRVQWKWLITSLLAGGAVIDVTIAASMLYYLIKKRLHALNRVNRVIDRLAAITIRTGLVTSIAAVVLLISFLMMPQNMVWLAIYTILARLYSNTLLSSLNARHRLRNDITNSSVEVYSKGKTIRRDTMDPTSRHGAISIEMKTTTETVGDDGKGYLHGMEDNVALEPPRNNKRSYRIDDGVV